MTTAMATKPAYLTMDNLDDRTEVYRLLSKLSPGRRLAWLRWCCARAVLPNSATHPGPARKTLELADLARLDSSADVRLTLDIYFDFWSLTGLNYELDPNVALTKLVAMVRRRSA